MVSGNTHFFRFLIAGLLIALFWGCQRKPDLQVNETISCDLEQVTEDGKSFISDSHPGEFFNGADKRSGDEARSGKYSILLRNGRAFGLDFRLGNVSADEYYRVSIWRKGNVDKGFINVGDKDGKYFYKATEEHDSVGADGWKRLSLTFHVPPNLNNATLKIYAWNPNDDSIYYDDISISRLTPKEYPAYEGITGLKLFIDTLNTFKLAEKRKQAFDNFILATEDDDWVEGMFFYGEGMYRTDLRLKGDWLDHLLGAKWSFRIEVKDNQTWNGMRTFSVQNPESRDFLNEWLMHEFCRDHDILATRYGFTPLSLNNKSLGIYAWEEHFEKYLVESNNRREGPILKVNEDALWENARLREKYKEDIRLPVVPAAEIMPFKAKKTAKDQGLFGQYLIAQELYYQYKYARNSISEIFDTDKLARFMAMIDLFRTYHGVTWHNQRFYYNPVLSKLEPIAFDNFSEKGPVQYYAKSIIGNHYLDLNIAEDENILLGNIFRDTTFNRLYIKYLEIFSNEAFLRDYLDEKSARLWYYDSLISLEYPGYHFDENYYFENARLIREELPEFRARTKQVAGLPTLVYREENPPYGFTERNEISEKFVQAYREESTDTSSTIRVLNYFVNELLLLGTSKNGRSIRDFFLPEVSLPAVQGRNPGDTLLPASDKAEYLHYMVRGDITTYIIPVYPWPCPEGKETPRQQLKRIYGNNFRNYFTASDKSELIMVKGSYNIDHPVIIPEGYRVIIQAGAEINLTNKAAFISFSPVSISGSADDPVVIKSSDGSSMGFSVMQAGNRSVVQHAVFDRLNTLDFEGWALTGAVTFYESDVDFYHCTFSNNLSEDGLNIIRSSFSIDHCEVLNTFADALDVDFGRGSITNTSFRYLSNDAIDVSGSDIVIENCQIMESKDKGISGGENSVVRVSDTWIKGTVIGMASKDFSRITSHGCTIEDCQYGLVAFRKKPEFGPASIIATDLQMKNIATPYLIEEGSACEANGEIIDDDSKDVYDIFYL